MNIIEKKSVKDFIKENKKAIIVGGGIGLLIAIYGGFMYYKGLRRGVEVTAIVEFHETISWFDKEFPGVDLRKLWDGWAAANPEKVVTIKF